MLNIPLRRHFTLTCDLSLKFLTLESLFTTSFKMMQATEMIKEYRSTHPDGTPFSTHRPPTPIPEAYKTVRNKIHAPFFCAVWLRGAFNVMVFQGNRQPIMHNCKLAGILVSLQLVIGIFLTGLGFHLQFMTPNLKMRDVPTWAGIPLGLTGLFGILFVSCCHREYPGNCGVFIMKAISFVFSAINVILCLCSAAFQSTHLITMSTYTDCATKTNDENIMCLCRIETSVGDRDFPYGQLKCEQVFTLLYMFLVVSSVVACLGAIFSFWFTILIWGSRYEHFYAGLRPNEDTVLPVFSKPC